MDIDLALSLAKAQVKELEWLIKQSENRLRQNKDLLDQAKEIVNSLST